MKKLILLVFLLLLTFLIYSKSKKISEEKNDIDYLEKIAKDINKNNLIKKYAYFFSSTPYHNNYKIYFETQFALAPHVLVRSKFEEIPRDSLILYIEKKKSKTPKEIKSLKDTLYFSDKNERFRYLILRKR
jgi:hypothetical protein